MKAYADEQGLLFFEMSAKTNVNIHEVFCGVGETEQGCSLVICCLLRANFVPSTSDPQEQGTEQERVYLEPRARGPTKWMLLIDRAHWSVQCDRHSGCLAIYNWTYYYSCSRYYA